MPVAHIALSPTDIWLPTCKQVGKINFLYHDGEFDWNAHGNPLQWRIELPGDGKLILANTLA